jgi:predicted ATPase with chaperone activity
VQARRFAAQPHLTCNADIGPAEVRQYCEVEPGAQLLLRAASQRLQLSARAFHRMLKLARTIADLASAPRPLPPRTWLRRCNTARGWMWGKDSLGT